MRIIITICTILMMASFSSEARDYRNSKVRPELRLLRHLRNIAKIRFNVANVQLEPWLECKNIEDDKTFFSSSLYKYGTPERPREAIIRWAKMFHKTARKLEVEFISCFYDINYFNMCYARGKFEIISRQNKIVHFFPGKNKKWCDQNSSARE